MHEKISLVSANVYPQLQDKFCIVNAPSWMSWLMSIFRKILSKRSMDKVELFTSDEEMWNSEWAKKRLVRELLPSFMGGGVMEAISSHGRQEPPSRCSQPGSQSEHALGKLFG